jgi:tellurite resistance protein TerC
MFSSEFLVFALFLVFIGGMLLLDLGVLSKKSHIVSFKEAATWSTIWILLALSFYVLLRFKGELIHGIHDFTQLQETVERYSSNLQLNPTDFEGSLQIYRDNISLEFITGYLVEYALSVDNIFVIIVIFTSFGVRKKYYKQVLFWGI